MSGGGVEAVTYRVTLVVLGADFVGLEATVTVTIHRGVGDNVQLGCCWNHFLEGTPRLLQSGGDVALQNTFTSKEGNYYVAAKCLTFKRKQLKYH